MKVWAPKWEKIFLAAFLFSTGMYTDAQPSLVWAKNIGGSRGLSVKTDAAGNVYTTGYFGGVGDFDPGPGTFFLTADGGDAYVSKLDANGNFVWALLVGGNSGTNQGVSVLPDASGNIYIAGHFNGTVDFDPGPATFNITSNGQSDISVLKLDANGNFIWAKNIGGTSGDLAYAATLDPAGNICVTGVFNGLVDFDPGPGVFNLNGGGNNDCFILKLDANGNFLQALQIANSYSEGDAITIDAAGNLYFCGNYSLTVDLNPGVGVFNVTATSGADAFVVKLDNTGAFVWGKSFGGFGTDNCRSVKVDATGNVYLAGDFPFTVDFDPGPGVFNITVAGSLDGYILKLDAGGNFVWAKNIGGINADAARDIVLDAAANVYITGLFQATVDFDPGPGVFNLTAFSNDIFIAKLTTAGDFGWALRYGGATLDEGISLFNSATGNLYGTGYFNDVVDFDPGPGTTSLNSANGATYIVNLGPGGTVPLSLLNFSGNPNPAGNLLQWTTASETNTKHFEVEWSSSEQQYNSVGTVTAAGNSSQTLQYNYLHSQPVSGNNYYRLKMVDIDGRFTYSPVIVISSNASVSSVKVFPNPVTDVLQLYIQSEKRETIIYNLYSADGKIIASKSFELVKGSNLLSWNVQQLASGNYFLSAAGNRGEAIKIIKK